MEAGMSLKYSILLLSIINTSAYSIESYNYISPDISDITLDHQEANSVNVTNNPLENLKFKKDMNAANANTHGNTIYSEKELFSSQRYVDLGKKQSHYEASLPTVEAMTQKNLNRY